MKHQDCSNVTREAVRHERKTAWLRHVDKGAEALANGRWLEAWRWVRATVGGRGCKPCHVQPVHDAAGELQVDPESIAVVWADHYARLGDDETGHSKDAEHWRRKRVPVSEAMDELNQPIGWRELNHKLATIRCGKAPGQDGLLPEWFKSMAEDGEPGDKPASPMGKIFLRMVQGMWERAYIPKGWREATVVSVSKKGDLKRDLTRVDNYRGISLIAVALKVLCSIIIDRITRSLEDRGLLCREQAGFRSREECAGQVITLYETVRRRQLEGLPTFAAFVDFRKAYDTVPHNALLRKLDGLGVRGKTLDFIRALYGCSEARVRVGHHLSSSFPLKRGVRQGCPMSPMLFNVFINDILRHNGDNGVSIPGVANEKLSGLLFADDLVLLAPTVGKLRAAMRKTEEWAHRWEMQIGAPKCGVTVFHSDVNQQRGQEWLLQGQPVPVVESYTYLGIELNHRMDLRATSAAITARTRKALWSIKPALTNRSIPFETRVLMLKALILPIASMGGELLGMKQQLANQRQQLVSQAVSWIYSGDRAGRGVMAVPAASLDLDLPPLSAIIFGAIMSGRRARSWAKFPTLRTWSGILMSQPFRTRGSTWVSGTKRWLTRYAKEVPLDTLTPPKCGRAVQKVIWQRYLGSRDLKSVKWYEENHFGNTRKVIRKATQYPRLVRGVEWLLRMRIQAIWTSNRAAKAGLIDPEAGERCPSCGERVIEDIPHILLECKDEANARHEMIQPLISKAAEQLSALPDRWELAVLILGGQVGEGTLSPWWLEGTAQSGGHSVPGFSLVAEFLQTIMPKRMGRLWKLREPQGTDEAQGLSSQPDKRVDAQEGYGRQTSREARQTKEVFSVVQIPTLPELKLVVEGVIIPITIRK